MIDRVAIFEVNESAYDLLSRCAGNLSRTQRQIIAEVVDLYIDDAQVGHTIRADLQEVIRQMVAQSILRIVAAPNTVPT